MAELQPTASATTPPTGASMLYQNLSAMPVIKQVSLIIALAATIAIGVALVLWSQAPSYALLFGGLDSRQAADIVKALDAQAVPYQYDTNTGSLTVPAARVHELRLKLAAEGLPKSAETGYQILDKDQGFGVSQFKENVQYIRALEGELAQSIAAIAAVKSARVHLAIPKRTVFVRKEQETTASVVVNLHGSLSEAQVNAIMHLVASSVPNMKAANVSVVDQSGNLLSQQSPNLGMNMSLKQLEYTRNIEQTLAARIQDLLSPLVGSKGVRAQVTAEVDFTKQEQTRENFNPDPEAVRSSQEIRERNKAAGPEGIPGALTNQPPQAGIAPEEDYPGKDKNGGLAKDLQSEKITKNYEIDRTITHLQSQVGTLKRLSVAVVVDDRVKTNEEGALQRMPLTEEELARFKNLVRDAVGVDEARGDNLSLVNISFQSEAEEDVGLPIWQQAWFWDVMKQVAGGLAVLLIIFGVLRPLLRDLTGVKEREKLAEDLPDEDEEEAAQLAAQQADQNARLAGGDAAIAGTLNALDEQQQEQLSELEKEDIDLVAHIRTQIEADPKVAAKVLREWMTDKG
ncbi:MAG: flagellar M-ring protein FliF [Thiotrichales bacterium 32-46-8]|nr:flagellar M-ring protein FliF [Gammaproteobacteria bacterium]OYX07678.1 MAG: flagellar M-ring protein FliF [Thiotrichales bacterium 32-46-8]OYY24310.1 MAG: flagellar M-ring protein FliF [Thiotrichales bacterium 35-46-9]OYZ07317.1 MAG: flagellar M-ring protein FliF [Thiotrichales bacterium 16-46-22]OZA18225.1 MAG: flagellar M-ring protein FliF [Thiotrichales bacterium 17-46-47]OZA97810.1 MAG: flagellar M-ring protein FliF [Thiotrichales bacterium 34-46-19]UCG18526.1 MAG: flagellar M-ring pr